MNEMGYSSMQFRNVVSKEYLDFSIYDVEKCILEFYEKIKENDLEINGPLIMVYTQIMKDYMVNVELMTPVTTAANNVKYFDFRSYLCIDQMVHGRMQSDNYEDEEQKVIADMERFIKENKLKRISPYYHIINNIDGLAWVDIKAKVLEL